MDTVVSGCSSDGGLDPSSSTGGNTSVGGKAGSAGKSGGFAGASGGVGGSKAGTGGTSAGKEETAEECQNGLDDDGDGKTDCEDPTCKANFFTTLCTGLAGSGGSGGLSGNGGNSGGPAGSGGASGKGGSAGSGLCFDVSGGSHVCVQSSDAGFDPKAKGLGVIPAPPGGLPASAALDLGGFAVADQGSCGSCVAFAVRSAMGARSISEKHAFTDFSAPHIWKIAGHGAADCAVGTDIFKVMTENTTNATFVVSSSVWPYNPASPEDSLNTPPGDPQLSEGGVAFIKGALGISQYSVNDIKAAIAQGWPAVVGVTCCVHEPAWYDTGDIGVSSVTGSDCGGHAITVVAYDDATATFTFVNSWGASWGKNNDGRGTMTYEFVEQYMTGGMALKSLSYRADCPTNFCSAKKAVSGSYCNGTGPGSTALTCGVQNGCPTVVVVDSCQVTCENNLCVSCSDGKQNGSETGVDCGGSCPPCNVGTCSDGQQNQGEQGVDCGGPCVACTCSDGKQNGTEKGVDCGGDCQACPETCHDGLLNQDEEGVDCGGNICSPCISCTDNTQNGDETGVDCGGICPECLVTPTCNDNTQNGDETGVDCGGNFCPPCDIASCTNNKQDGLETGVDCGGICPPCDTSSCADNIQNGSETGVDCGGSCPACSAQVTTLSPLSATVGTSTTFTVSGSNLPSTLQLYIPGCTASTSTSGGSTSRSLTCTPLSSGTVTAEVKDKAGGSILKTFTVSLNDAAIVVTKLSPLSATVGTSTTFTVSGSNLPSTLQLYIPGCTASTSTSGGSTSRSLTCTPLSAGNVTAEVKDKAGGSILKTFNVKVF